MDRRTERVLEIDSPSAFARAFYLGLPDRLEEAVRSASHRP